MLPATSRVEADGAKRMAQFAGSVLKYPARASFAWYGGLILLGTLVLRHPACRASSASPVSALDAAFTATSAACVTGLTVRSTGHDFSLAGQIAILALIQIGGIGIMTVTTFVTLHLGGAKTLRDRVAVLETLGAGPGADLGWVLRHVVLMTFLFEGVGFLLLASRFILDYPWQAALWHGLFHAVSAFCNAGFSLNDDNLVRYQGDPLVNLTIVGLIVTGGLGFPVMLDLRSNLRSPWSRLWDRLHLHSKLMLLGTAGLLGFGALSFLLLEWSNSLHGMPVARKILVSLFQATVPRTAGFNTVDIGSLTNATLLVLMLLMMVGAGPCSTGGGFKVSTLMVLVVRAWSAFQGHTRASVFRRTIPPATLARATTTALLYAVVAASLLTGLLVFEQARLPRADSQGLFVQALFEVISALGTVGLSTGMTPMLTEAGRILVILAMFIGRLGPISVFIALSRGERVYHFEFPEEEPLIG